MTPRPTDVRGECHCGNIGFQFKTAHTPETLIIKNCQCSFCLKHGATTARDPEGEASIVAQNRESVILYRFGTKTTDFIVCGNCGVYVGAVIAHEGRRYATLNMNLTNLDTQQAEPIVYADEPPESRIQGRVKRFTPVTSYPL